MNEWRIVKSSSQNDWIDEELRMALAARNRQAQNSCATYIAQDSTRKTLGGVILSTSYSWLHIEALWVAETMRGQGLGRALMARAFAFGGDCACHSAWLDTSNPDAKAFYERLGFEVFGELANSEEQFPPEHRRWFLKRTINKAH